MSSYTGNFDTLPAVGGGGVTVAGQPRMVKHSSNTVAERVVWMTRTSDVLGSHIRTDLESYLTLIRRKIQEKCSSTQELILHIRRNKIGDKVHVTPNEFRFTLIKFGVILPQSLVDKVFAVFDSDRSGTMDFDEFAMWIMNSEFRPALKNSNIERQDPMTELLQKLRAHQRSNPNAFAMMKKNLTFIEFLADITRLNLNITDKEARSMFVVFDPENTGFVESDAILHWINTGEIELTPKPTPEQMTLKQMKLNEIILKISGRSNKVLELCFQHIPSGQGIKLPFEEFRSCLVGGGVGNNIEDVRALFNALGGATNGVANVDLLRSSLTDFPIDGAKTIVSKKVLAPNLMSARAERLLRDSIRKCYREIKEHIEAVDRTGSGYIRSIDLYNILVRECMPIAYQDFRYLLQKLPTDDGESMVNWKSFLQLFNPLKNKHVLDTPAECEAALTTANSMIHHARTKANLNSNLTGVAAGASSSSPTLGIESFSLSNNNNNNNNNNNSNNVSSSIEGSNKGVDRAGGRAGEMPALRPGSSGAERLLAKQSMDRRAATASSALRPRPGADSLRAESPASLRKSFDSSLNLNKSESVLNSFDVHHEMKKFWHAALKECHKVDVDRTGLIRRETFIQIMEGCNISKVLGADTFQRLAEEFSVNRGLVNYNMFFKAQLSAHQTVKPAASPIKPEPSKTLHLASHPWEFDYKREKPTKRGPAHPYWQTASALPRTEHNAHQMMTASLSNFSASIVTKASTAVISATEKALLLSQYSTHALNACSKCYREFLPVWRDLRTALKDNQISSMKGHIVHQNFLNVLQAFNIKLSKNEIAILLRAFRAIGMQDVVKYDEFLRVCLLVKDSPPF